MHCSRAHLFALLVVAVCPGGSHAQTKAAPFYSLPADGAWVEYEWRRTAAETKEEGTLRISSVGAKDIDGTRCRWVEVKVETRAGDKTKWQVRKLLVAERPFRNGRPLQECVVECYHQDDASRTVTRLSKPRLDEFLSL